MKILYFIQNIIENDLFYILFLYFLFCGLFILYIGVTVKSITNKTGAKILSFMYIQVESFIFL
jgi:hypothetical protein